MQDQSLRILYRIRPNVLRSEDGLTQFVYDIIDHGEIEVRQVLRKFYMEQSIRVDTKTREFREEYNLAKRDAYTAKLRIIQRLIHEDLYRQVNYAAEGRFDFYFACPIREINGDLYLTVECTSIMDMMGKFLRNDYRLVDLSHIAHVMTDDDVWRMRAQIWERLKSQPIFLMVVICDNQKFLDTLDPAPEMIVERRNLMKAKRARYIAASEPGGKRAPKTRKR